MIFIEVKSRFSSKFGAPIEAIDLVKRFKIIKVATYYLTITKTTDYFIRFDSIEVNFSRDYNSFEIIHQEDAFRT